MSLPNAKRQSFKELNSLMSNVNTQRKNVRNFFFKKMNITLPFLSKYSSDPPVILKMME